MKSPICIQCTVYTHMIGYKRWSKVTYSHEIILWRVRDIYFQERPHFYRANLVCNLDGPKTFDKGKKQIAKHIVIKTIFTYPPPAMTERAAILYVTQSETFKQRCMCTVSLGTGGFFIWQTKTNAQFFPPIIYCKSIIHPSYMLFYWKLKRKR